MAFLDITSYEKRLENSWQNMKKPSNIGISWDLLENIGDVMGKQWDSTIVSGMTSTNDQTSARALLGTASSSDASLFPKHGEMDLRCCGKSGAIRETPGV